MDSIAVDMFGGQLCQSFDPMMVLPEKTYGIVRQYGKAGPSTSCVAPAFVYLEGSRGKRYLCDFHYIYEKKITQALTPELWPAIERKSLNNIDSIVKTFAENCEAKYELFGQCWCGSQSSVRILAKSEAHLPEEAKKEHYRYFCNFHFRKLTYRYLSNGRSVPDTFNVDDARRLMKIVPSTEALGLRLEQI